MVKSGSKWDFRDISAALQILRTFLLGRDHSLHNRFAGLVSPRTIPQPDVPRAPELKLSNHYYHQRCAAKSVKPPIVAPIAEGPPLGHDPTIDEGKRGIRPDTVCFTCLPTPGPTWWWDGHYYFEEATEHPFPVCPPPAFNPSPPPPPPCPNV